MRKGQKTYHTNCRNVGRLVKDLQTYYEKKDRQYWLNEFNHDQLLELLDAILGRVARGHFLDVLGQLSGHVSLQHLKEIETALGVGHSMSDKAVWHDVFQKLGK